MITPDPRHRGISLRPGIELLFALILASVLNLPQNVLGADKKDKDKDAPYGLIAGTVWGPDDRPVYGVTVKIRRSTDKPKKVRWQVYSDHHGEFAQRVPAGDADYVLSPDLKGVKSADGRPLHAEPVTVHIYNDEREDTGLHLKY